MAIAQRNAGVRPGYKVRANRKARQEPSLLQRALASLRGGARELYTLIGDEIVYATMDTVRVMNYVRYELRLQSRSRVEPVVQEFENFVYEHERRSEMGTFSAEQVR